MKTTFGSATLPTAFTYKVAGNFFIRGDCNSDATIKLADAISLLQYLFSGGSDPLCSEAYNGDDDDGLNLADAISILTYLFNGAKIEIRLSNRYPVEYINNSSDNSPTQEKTCY